MNFLAAPLKLTPSHQRHHLRRPRFIKPSPSLHQTQAPFQAKPPSDFQGHSSPIINHHHSIVVPLLSASWPNPNPTRASLHPNPDHQISLPLKPINYSPIYELRRACTACEPLKVIFIEPFDLCAIPSLCSYRSF